MMQAYSAVSLAYRVSARMHTTAQIQVGYGLGDRGPPPPPSRGGHRPFAYEGRVG